MKKNMFKKGLSLVLACMLVLSCMSISAFAAGVIVEYDPTATNLLYKGGVDGVYNNGGTDAGRLNYNLTGELVDGQNLNKIHFVENIILGTTPAYSDRTNVIVTEISNELADGVLLAPGKNDGGAKLSEGAFFTDDYNGLGDTPAWFSFDVSAGATVYVFDRFGSIYTQSEWTNLVNLGYTKNAGVYIKAGLYIAPEYSYSKHYAAGETVKIPSYGRPGPWADAEKDETIPYDPPVYVIVWDEPTAPAGTEAKTLSYTADGTTTDIALEAGKLEYKVYVPEGTASVSVNATAEAGMNVSYSADTLTAFPGSIDVTILNAAGEGTEYTVNFEVESRVGEITNIYHRDRATTAVNPVRVTPVVNSIAGANKQFLADVEGAVWTPETDAEINAGYRDESLRVYYDRYPSDKGTGASLAGPAYGQSGFVLTDDTSSLFYGENVSMILTSNNEKGATDVVDNAFSFDISRPATVYVAAYATYGADAAANWADWKTESGLYASQGAIRVVMNAEGEVDGVAKSGYYAMDNWSTVPEGITTSPVTVNGEDIYIAVGAGVQKASTVYSKHFEAGSVKVPSLGQSASRGQMVFVVWDPLSTGISKNQVYNMDTPGRTGNKGVYSANLEKPGYVLDSDKFDKVGGSNNWNGNYAVQDGIVLGETLVYSDRADMKVQNYSSKLFEGATVIRRAKGDAGGAGVVNQPYTSGAFDGKNGNPYWLTFNVSSACTVYMADGYAAGWPNNDGTWKNDTKGLLLATGAVQGGGEYLYYKHFEADELVEIPNYGMPADWNADTVKYDPPVYVIVWDDMKPANDTTITGLTYSVDGGDAVAVEGFDAAKTTYDVVLPAGSTKAGAWATKTSAYSNIVTSGEITEFPGSITVDIYAADGVTKGATYTINFTVEGGAAIVYGDVTGDGKVNALDRATISRYVAKWTAYATMENEAGGDVTGDGKINALDRATVSRHVAKWNGYDVLPKL